MPELAVILQKLESIETIQHNQSDDIKELSKGFSILAAQNEQITNLQSQTHGLWKKYDDLTRPESVIEKIREHQKGCPKEQVKLMWKAFSVNTAVILALVGWFLYHITQR